MLKAQNRYVFILPLPNREAVLVSMEDGTLVCDSCGNATCEHVDAANTLAFYGVKLAELAEMQPDAFIAYYDAWWPKRGVSLRELEEGGERFHRADAFFQALQDAMRGRRKVPNPNPAPDEDPLTYMYDKKEG
jgi:hypothetical protein